MKRTIRWRLIIPYVILVTILLTGMAVYLTNAIRQTYDETWRSNLTASARMIASQASGWIDSNSTKGSLDSKIETLSTQLNARITLIAEDGTVLGESTASIDQMENHFTRPEVLQALSNQEGYQIRFSTTLNIKMLYVAVPVTQNGEVVAAVRLAVPLNMLDTKLNSINLTIGLITLVTCILSILLAYLVVNSTLLRLKHLQTVATQISAGNYGIADLSYTNDEYGQIFLALHKISDQLAGKADDFRIEQNKLTAVLSKMSDGVLLTNSDGNIQLINSAAERIFKVKASSVLGHSVVEVVRHYQLVETWKKAVRTGEQRSTTLEIKAENLFLQCEIIPLGPRLPGSALILCQDMTRLRHLEIVRRDFVSNVSHELRTPLASLKALVETLQEGALEDPPAAQRFLMRMETEIDTLTQLVQELLELSKIESGKVPLQLKPVNPQVLLRQAVERITLQAERAGLNLRMDSPADLPDVMADPDRMEQVLVNLLHNAVKFTAPNGEIVASAYREGDKVIFFVKDTGVGISASDLPRIFERFYKADRARSGGGTGLGLSIARHMVESHQGRLWAESELGVGSTFYFSLPIA